MAIRVRFDKNGFYHPAFGRLGRGKNEGRVYVLPDEFGEEETIEVPLMDTSRKPPRPSGQVRSVTRYKNIPSSATIISKDEVAQLKALAEEGDPDAKEEYEEITQAIAPKVVTPEKLQKTPGRGTTPKAQDAKERTVGARRRRSKKAAPTA